MKPNQAIIDLHEQKFFLSCIPSAIEMILKLEGKVDQDYYELQTEWNNNAGRSFDYFDNRTIHNLTYHRKENPDDNIPYIIGEEITKGRYVAISIKNPKGFHIWVIYDKKKPKMQSVFKGT